MTDKIQQFSSGDHVLKDNAHAELWGNAHAVLRDNAHAELWDFSVGIKLSVGVKLTVGSRATVIVPEYPKSVLSWARMKGLAVVRGHLHLWKAVTEKGTDLHTGKINYLGRATAPDWDVHYANECGAGLHLADSPSGARWFVRDNFKDSFRLFMVKVAVKDCRCFAGSPSHPMKLRARTCEFVKEYPRDYDPMNEKQEQPA